MKTKHLLLLVLIAAFSSCSSAFRTGQTPDDVYYSPAPPPPVEYVRTDNQQDRDRYAYNNTFNSEDLAIRRGINDPRYRSNISLDFGYGYSPYNYGYSPFDYYGSSLYGPYSSYYNPYAHMGLILYPYNYNYYSYYSPFNNYYYPSVYFSKHGSPVSNYSSPRTFNLGAYNNNTGANRVYTHPAQITTNNSAPARTFPSQSSNRSGVGNFIRRVFTPSNNTRSYSSDNSSNINGSNNSSPARTMQTNTSGSSSSSSSSSGSSSAPVRTFRR